MNRDTESVVALTPNVGLILSLTSSHYFKRKDALEAPVGNPQAETDARNH
jgi:hypothetical protein